AAAALAKVRELCVEFRLLGSYDVAAAPARANEKGAPPRAAVAPVPVADAEPKLPAAAKNWPQAARPTRPQGTRARVRQVEVGGDQFIVVAGPCSVESREQVLATAEAVHARGAVMLRGGAFKPRTSPYAFQGLGWEGLDLLAEAGRATGMPIVTEV